MNSKFELKNPLSALGMSSAFDMANADFSGMSGEGKADLVLDEVFHKAFVKVNEEGTEAAAATGAVMMLRCAMVPRQPMKIDVDHPYLFVVVDKRANDNVLFFGKIHNPSA